MIGSGDSVLPRGAGVEAILADPGAGTPAAVPRHAALLLETAEDVVANWLRAHGEIPTDDAVEGFRLLALHRQGARLDPSFNACRESCRELIYQCNMARAHRAEAGRRLRMAAMVCRHLQLFVAGKMENAALGEFCCAAKPLRTRDTT